MLEKREPEEIVTNEQANATVDLFWEQEERVCLLTNKLYVDSYINEPVFVLGLFCKILEPPSRCQCQGCASTPRRTHAAPLGSPVETCMSKPRRLRRRTSVRCTQGISLRCGALVATCSRLVLGVLRLRRSSRACGLTTGPRKGGLQISGVDLWRSWCGAIKCIAGTVDVL